MRRASHFELAPVAASVRRVRAAVRDDATLADLPEDTKRDVTLIVSELISNAIAASIDGDPVLVDISRNGSAVVLVVRNTGTMTFDQDLFDLPSPDEPQGRGLAIVHRLARRVEITSSAGTTTVRAVIDADAAEAASLDGPLGG